MAYIDELLGRDENIIYEARQHLIVLVTRILTKVILIGILVSAGLVSNQAFGHHQEPVIAGLTPGLIIPLLSGFISLLLLISVFSDYFRWNAEQFVITDRRVLHIQGFLTKAVTDASLEKINNMGLSQSLFGRMFRYGTLQIWTASEDNAFLMTNVPNPFDFKRALQEARYNFEHGFGYLDTQDSPPRTDGHTTPDIQGQGSYTIHQTLEELATLRDRGILSIDEFEAKKRELLNRI
jgi:hypothetical protein